MGVTLTIPKPLLNSDQLTMLTPPIVQLLQLQILKDLRQDALSTPLQWAILNCSMILGGISAIRQIG